MVVRLGTIILAALLLFSLAVAPAIADVQTAGVQGTEDLSAWNFKTRGNATLNGEWAFYWNRLLSPGEFNGVEPTGYFTLPSYWTRYPGLQLPSFGSATYRLTVDTDGTAGLYALEIPEIYTEYTLWVNGTLAEANGSFASQEPIYLHPYVYDFYLAGPQIELVLQIKNTAHAYGGVGQGLRLGTSQEIHQERNAWAALDIALISIVLFAGLYYLVFYLFKRDHAEQIWFFVLCVSVATRNLFSNTTLAMQVWPGLPFWLGSKIVTLTIPAIVLSMLFYTQRLMKNGIPAPVFRGFAGASALYALIVLFAPSSFYARLFPVYLLIVGVACAMGLGLSARAVARHEKEAGIFFAGMLLLTGGALVDSLIYLQVFSAQYVLSAALFGYIALQSVLLAKRYADAFRHAELLSADLQRSLDKQRDTETAFLSAQMKPHFLYNTLTVIAEKCETEPAEAGKLILSLSKYLRHTLDYDNLGGSVSLKKELELVTAYTAIERARFANIEIVIDVPEDCLSLRLPPMSLQPLVENAIKHGLRKRREGGRVVLSARHGDACVRLEVRDNGIGIPPEVLQRLIVLPNGSVSIGLYNIHTRLLRLYGKGLSIQSESGAGTSVSFEIPI